MIDAATIKATIGAIISVGGVVAYTYQTFTPEQQFRAHVAESTAGTILQLVRDAQNEPPGPYKDSLCRTLEQKLSELCRDAPDDAICQDRAVYRAKAGCS